MGKDLEKEWKRIREREERLTLAAEKKREGKIKEITGKIERKIPDKFLAMYDAAFYKAFLLIFEKGTNVIEKTFSKEDAALEFRVNHFRMEQSPTRKSLKKLEKAGKRKNLANSCITALEGTGLGLLGIGLPDIPIFLGMILKGLYETATSYGFDYDRQEEKVFILRLIAAGLAEGGEKREMDERMEDWAEAVRNGDAECCFEEEVRGASAALSKGMLTAKFIQGLPVVGAIGGAVNLAVYRKILSFAALKYKKRYLAEMRKDV